MKTAVRLGPKFYETVKGKLSLGARILQLGGVKRVFRQFFGSKEGEKLLKASQCYLSTTAGPIAGLLFISTRRVAFCSDKSIKFSCPNGELIRIHYKVGYSHSFLYVKISLPMFFLTSKYIHFLLCRSPSHLER